MDIVINMAFIAFSVCYIVDISGIIAKLNKWCWVRLFGANLQYNGWYIPVIGCSSCLTFLITLEYSLVISDFEVIASVEQASFFSYISPILTLSLKRVIKLLSDCLLK